MKKILQHLKTGQIILEDIPCPKINPGEILIQTSKTLISAGTERMLLEFGKASLLGKIRQQPDKVRQVLDKIKTDGLVTTLEAVKSKLDQPVSLGYCNVGTVLAVGSQVKNFAIGDRVISNGGHSEVVVVPENLCAKIPSEVSDEQAVFTVLAAIGLQGIRLAEPTMGECFVVFGLGLIGLLTVQLLKAQGCRVLGIDFDESRCELARQYGALTVNGSLGSGVVDQAMHFSRDRGIDGVIITASTPSNDVVHHAALMSRKRGRIILIGVVGLELSRADFYEKELTFQVSCSYGPGRYENNYEQKGLDYPIGFVRWTEQRNFEAVLDLFLDQKISVKNLITHEYLIDQAPEAYQTLSENKKSLGILLNYPARPLDEILKCSQRIQAQAQPLSGSVGMLFLGAGNYASRVLMPAFKKAGARFVTLVSRTGVSGVLHGKKQGFEKTSTDYLSALLDPSIQAVAIATQHGQHAEQTIEALKAGKHVFVEKPLAVTQEQLDQLKNSYEKLPERPLVMVGFNRRFSPHIQKIKKNLDQQKMPKSMIYTINAGAIDSDHWTFDSEAGGGRLIGEACHFVDLLMYLSGGEIISQQIMSIEDNSKDKFTIQLKFSDGSIGTIHYFANGSKQFPKERLEIFSQGKIYQLDNFRKLTAYGDPHLKSFKTRSIDKGQAECSASFLKAITEGQSSPIVWEELVAVTQCCLDLEACIA